MHHSQSRTVKYIPNKKTKTEHIYIKNSCKEEKAEGFDAKGFTAERFNKWTDRRGES